MQNVEVAQSEKKHNHVEWKEKRAVIGLTKKADISVSFLAYSHDRQKY